MNRIICEDDHICLKCAQRMDKIVTSDENLLKEKKCLLCEKVKYGMELTNYGDTTISTQERGSNGQD